MPSLILNTGSQPPWPVVNRSTHNVHVYTSCCFNQGCFKRLQILVRFSTDFLLQMLPYFVIQRIQVWAGGGPFFEPDEVDSMGCQPILRACCPMSRRRILLEYPVSVFEHCVRKRFYNVCKHRILVHYSTGFYSFLTKKHLTLA